MRSERNTIQIKKKKTVFGRFTRLWSVILLLGSLFFAGLIAYSGLLTTKLLIIACAVIFVVFLLLFPALWSFRFKKSRKALAFVMSLLIGAVYGVGGYYLGGTLDFINKISSVVSITRDTYYVIVRDDGQFEELGDIEGSRVISLNGGDSLPEAEKKLQEKVQVKLYSAENNNEAAEALLTGDEDVLFMSSANYAGLNGSFDNFDDDTKILEKITILTSGGGTAKGVTVTEEPFNVLISGLDTEGDIGETSRSDVNMIMTVNPNTRSILLTSIPRDYYVEYPDVPGAYDKLTHSGIYGVDETVATVEKLMDIDINYYVKVNYSTITSLVDAIDGIDVESDYNFETHGQEYYHFSAGMNHLDGAEALAFARERQAFEDGDFQRNRNQQLVLKALIQKLTSSRTILLKYRQILNSLENYIEINMSGDEIKALVRMQLADMSGWNIETQSIIGGIDTLPCYAIGNEYASVVTQDPDSVAQAREAIMNVMGIYAQENPE